MLVHFLLPEINFRHTGGNIYNRQILNYLKKCAKVKILPVRKGEINLPSHPAEVTVIDSLLLNNGVEFIPELPKGFVLLLHYLPEMESGKFNALPWLKQCGAILCTSRFSQEFVSASLPHEPLKIGLAEPGLSEEYFRPLPEKKAGKPIRLITTANLLPNKQYLEAVQLLARWFRRDWRWDVWGETALDKKYTLLVEESIRKLGLAEEIRLHQVVPPEQVPSLLDEADIFFLPTRFETFGMAAAEAAARGKRIVAFRTGGLTETLKEYPAVYWAARNDWSGLLDALTAAAEDWEKARNGAVQIPPGWRFGRWEDTGRAVWNFLRHIVAD